MSIAHRALVRFGLGARPGEAERLDDPQGWLLGQLEGPPPLLEGPELVTRAEAGEALRTQRRALANGGDADAPPDGPRPAGAIRQAEITAALERRVTTERPFVERLVAFWSNHLCVSLAGGPQLAALAGLYEREVVRPHALGRFDDMVVASVRHPAMLLYLDNARSIGPNSPRARAASRRTGVERGLNENHARELLELHTLGVDGGYDQADVEELARLLTGWTVAGLGPLANGPLGFAFDPALHEPGARSVLGRRYAGGGAEAGEAAIRDLCAHPSTARHLARKLVEHFVADAPPAPAVDRVAAVFLDTGGDLKAVAASLVPLEEAWDPANRKFRSPQDWMVAALRALQVPRVPPVLARGLQALRHPMWAPPSPKGFGDRLADWADPDALMNRAEFARTLVQRVGRIRLDPRALEALVELPESDPLPDFLADGTIAPDERIALALGGPAFQWR